MQPTIGDRIRTERELQGMSQKELARRAGMRQQSLSKLERGESRDTRYAVQLARALGVMAEWLKTGHGPKTSQDLELLVDVSELPPDVQTIIKDAVMALKSGALPTQRFVAIIRAILDD